MEVLSIRPRESLGRPTNPFYLLHHMFCSSLPLYSSYSSFHIDSLSAKMISLWVVEDCHLRGPSWCCFVLQALLQAYWSHQPCKRFFYISINNFHFISIQYHTFYYSDIMDKRSFQLLYLRHHMNTNSSVFRKFWLFPFDRQLIFHPFP